jgi:hypothetical protein
LFLIRGIRCIRSHLVVDACFYSRDERPTMRNALVGSAVLLALRSLAVAAQTPVALPGDLHVWTLSPTPVVRI